MKKRNKIMLTTLGVASVSGSLVVGGLGISLGINLANISKENARNSRERNHNVSLNDKTTKTLDGSYALGNHIKYVALGDSTSAGFSALNTKEKVAGELKDGKITGYSYPSYVARSLNKLNKLDAYKNLSIPGFNSGILLNALNEKYAMSEYDKLSLKNNVGQDAYKNFNMKNYRKKIRNELKEANFATLSIGADDIMGLIKIGDVSLINMIEHIQKGELPKNWNINIDKKHIIKKIDEAIVHLEKIIMEIKLLNPSIGIFISGYPMPLLQFRNALARVTQMPTNIKNKLTSFSEFLLEKMNSIGKNVSQKFSSVDYGNPDQKKYWEDNSVSLSKDMFDIHPTVYGYRAMAGEVMASLTNTNLPDFVIKNDPNYSKKENVSQTRILEQTTEDKAKYTKIVENLYDLKVAPNDDAINSYIPFGKQATAFIKKFPSAMDVLGIPKVNEQLQEVSLGLMMNLGSIMNNTAKKNIKILSDLLKNNTKIQGFEPWIKKFIESLPKFKKTLDSGSVEEIMKVWNIKFVETNLKMYFNVLIEQSFDLFKQELNSAQATKASSIMDKFIKNSISLMSFIPLFIYDGTDIGFSALPEKIYHFIQKFEKYGEKNKKMKEYLDNQKTFKKFDMMMKNIKNNKDSSDYQTYKEMKNKSESIGYVWLMQQILWKTKFLLFYCNYFLWLYFYHIIKIKTKISRSLYLREFK